MENRIRNYIEGLFATLEPTAQVKEIKEEMTQNLTEKYNDLVAEGIHEETAYHMAVSGIGDVGELIQILQNHSQLTPQFYTENKQSTDENAVSAAAPQNGSYYVTTEGIDSIEVRWVNGSVECVSYEGDMIFFEEDPPFSGSESDQLRYSVSGTTLQIRFSSQMESLFQFWKSKKNLRIRLPKAFCENMQSAAIYVVGAKIYTEGITAKQIKLDAVSGPISAIDVKAEKLRMSSVSGKNTLENVDVDELRINIISGRVHFTGRCKEISMDSVSGNVSIDSTVFPQKSSFSIVSGNIDMHVPDNDGFTLGFSKVSGTLSSDFPMLEQGKKRIYKNGEKQIQVTSVSGNLKLRQR